eukprot:3198419-Pleurochrysis_carterae.AAC.1
MVTRSHFSAVPWLPPAAQRQPLVTIRSCALPLPNGSGAATPARCDLTWPDPAQSRAARRSIRPMSLPRVFFARRLLFPDPSHLLSYLALGLSFPHQLHSNPL